MEHDHELPSIEGLDAKYRSHLDPLHEIGWRCLDLEHALRTARLLEAGAHLKSERHPESKPWDVIYTAAVRYHDGVVRGYLIGVAEYTSYVVRPAPKPCVRCAGEPVNALGQHGCHRPLMCTLPCLPNPSR